jgi:linoleoyl-CoA desaturase
MGQSIQIKYKYSTVSSGFSKTLSQRVDEYFQTRRISRHANLEMISKTVLGFALWNVTYYWLITGRFSPLEIVGMFVLQEFAQLYMAFNIAHDKHRDIRQSSSPARRSTLSIKFGFAPLSAVLPAF